jgi:hypothetical protein
MGTNATINISAALDLTPPEAPVVKEVTDSSKQVTGTAEAGTEVTVKAGEKVLGTAKVKEDGTFLAAIPVQKAGTVLSVTAKDAAGNVSEAASVEVTHLDECFIATAAYGSKFGPAVTLLRQFRDNMLVTNVVGQSFVDFYYDHSPKIASFIAGNEVLKFIVRAALMPVVGVVYLLFHPIVLSTVLAAILSFLWWRRSKKASLQVR